MISLIHPSRGRYQKAYETAERWVDLAGCPVEHILSLDSSDPLTPQYRSLGQTLINDNTCVVEAANHAARASTGDILLYLSDDFDCFKDWGVKITEIASKYQGEYLIKVNDGLQRFDNDVLTIPIMSRPLYNHLKYFWHPSYKSMWVDVDLYRTCARIGVLKFHPEVTFQHNHYSNGKAKRDETYARSDANWEQGKAIMAERKGKLWNI